MNFDLFITNVRLLPGSGHDFSTLFDIGIKNGRFAHIHPADCTKQDIAEANVLDGAGNLLLPGLVNCHCHAPMTLFRGLADDLPLMSWLEEHIFPAEAKFVEPEMVYWCSKLAAAEMLKSGTTTVADGYFYEKEVARAFRDVGIRSIPAQGVIDFPAPGVPDPQENVAHAARFIDSWQNTDPTVIPGVFCHSPYTCGPETLQRAKQMARAKGAPFFIHVAETAYEVEQAKEQHGKAPVEYLHDLGLLDEQTVCIHCVWLTGAELDRLAATGARVVTCPESNMKLASGVARVPDMLERGITLGLGTDGCASNNDLDMFREMDTCAKLHKVGGMDPTLLSAETIFSMATLGGAKVLGLEKDLGSVELGKLADCIIVDLAQPHLTPFYTTGSLIYSCKGSDVKDSVINGEIVMRDRCVLGCDEKEILGRVRDLARNLTAKT